jgi:hypothetical protein
VTAGHQSSNRAAGRIRLCGGALRRDARSPREGCETREKGYSLFRVSRHCRQREPAKCDARRTTGTLQRATENEPSTITYVVPL